MILRRASIIPGTMRPCGDGITGAQTAVVQVDGATHRAYVKALPIAQCAAEAYCALLLRAWGLPVPEPAWIEHDGIVMFASLDAEYPSLKQRFQLNRPWPPAMAQRLAAAAAEVVITFRSAGLACAADEAILNADRNLGNILWDGSGEPSWIDHERAFQSPEGAENKLACMAQAIGKADEMRNSAVSAALLLARDVLQDVASCMPVDVRTFTELVDARLARIPSLVQARFPSSQPDLFQ